MDNVGRKLSGLKKENPIAYGVLRKNIDVVKKGIEQSQSKFPNSSELLECADAEGEFYAQQIGQSMSLLAELGVLASYRETNGSTRYDLTDYDTERMDSIRELLQ